MVFCLLYIMHGRLGHAKVQEFFYFVYNESLYSRFCKG